MCDSYNLIYCVYWQGIQYKSCIQLALPCDRAFTVPLIFYSIIVDRSLMSFQSRFIYIRYLQMQYFIINAYLLSVNLLRIHLSVQNTIVNWNNRPHKTYLFQKMSKYLLVIVKNNILVINKQVFVHYRFFSCVLSVILY